MVYALRIDGCLALVLAWLAREQFGGFGVRETVGGENEHWHFLCEARDKKISALRTALNRAAPELKGNGKYSLTEVRDVPKYERYLSKGNSEGESPEVVWRNSMLYTDDKIEELHTQYWDENRRLRKRKAGSMIDHAIDACKADGVSWDDRTKIGKIYIRALCDHNKPINTFSVRSALNAIQCALCPDDSAVDLLVGHCLAL